MYVFSTSTFSFPETELLTYLPAEPFFQYTCCVCHFMAKKLVTNDLQGLKLQNVAACSPSSDGRKGYMLKVHFE
jgi:hypothetical protein